MPDYSACQNTECPIRSKCARFRMPHGRRQSISWFDHEDCNAYWPAIPGDTPWQLLTIDAAEAQAAGVFNEDTLRMLEAPCDS